MNDDMKQQLSGLMDGEIEGHAEDTISQLIASPSLRDAWWRYHLISDAMHGNLPESTDRGLAARISADISGETVVFAQDRFTAKRFLKPAAGFAIAATVAAVAILGIQHHPASQVQKTAVQVAEKAPVTEKAPPVKLNVSRYTFPAAAGTAKTRDVKDTVSPRAAHPENFAQNPRLNSYLVNYNEFRSSVNGIQGIIPYARIIANDNDDQ